MFTSDLTTGSGCALYVKSEIPATLTKLNNDFQECIDHFCIIDWFPADKKSILEKQVTRTPLRGVLATCIFNIDYFKLGTSR